MDMWKISLLEDLGYKYNKPISLEKLEELYKRNFSEKFRQKNKIIRNNKPTFLAYLLRFLVANIGKEIIEDLNDNEIIDIFSEMGITINPKSHGYQLRHYGWVPSGNYAGFYILHGKKDNVKPNYIIMKEFKPHPNLYEFDNETLLSDEQWKELLKLTNNQCSVCHNPNEKNIEKGHLDSSKPLTMDNCMPMCHTCNHQTSQHPEIIYKLEKRIGDWYFARPSFKKSKI